jgi:hypothetical protein
MKVVKVTRFNSGPIVNRHPSPPTQIIQRPSSHFTPCGACAAGCFAR